MLCKVAPSPLRARRCYDDEGNLRLHAETVSFEGLLAAAFDPIRRAARAHSGVSLRMLDALATISRYVSLPRRRRAIREQADMVLQGGLEGHVPGPDASDLRLRHGAVVARLGESEQESESSPERRATA